MGYSMIPILGSSGVNPYNAIYEEVVVNEVGAIWYSGLIELNEVETWPTAQVVVDNNLGSERNGGNGGFWFDAWAVESGNLPVVYADAVSFTDAIWFSPLDEASDQFDVLATGAFTTAVIGSDTFYYFTGPGALITGDLGPATIDILEIAGGGAGCYDFGSAVHRWGGGGAGQYLRTDASVITAIMVQSVGVGGLIDFQNWGGSGTGTVTSLNTTLGGGGGGRFGVTEQNGRDGGSGGGGGESPGLGGTGLAGFDGGDGGASIGSGGGGAGGVGTSAASGDVGGPGLTWLDGVTYCKGGGNAGFARGAGKGSGGSCSADTTTATGQPGIVAIRIPG